MKKELRTKLLIEVGQNEAITFANEIIQNYVVEEIQPPRQGLTMIKVRESAQNSLFYIGEVLVTETKVKVGGSFGIGLVKEEQDTLSRALAVIDAAYKENLPETKQWEQVFEELEKRYQEQVNQLKYSIERTKVNFETMNS